MTGNQSHPSVCIMIPTYNQAAFICKAVESALAQDYPNLRILVTDDRSSDNTEEVLQPFIAAGKIVFRKNPVNLGRVKNYQESLRSITGADWVLNLDGDDYFTNTQFISQAMEAIQAAGEDTVLFYQGAHIYKQPGHEEPRAPNIPGDELQLSGEDYFFNYFRHRHFSHMSTLFNRSLALKTGFYENDVISSDVFSFMKYAISFGNYKVILSRNVSGVWLQHSTNSSKTIHLAKHASNFSVYRQLYRQALSKGYGKWKCFKWFLQARFMYLRNYAGSFLRRAHLRK